MVEGVECVLIANDPTVQRRRHQPVDAARRRFRAMEIAQENRLPLIQLVESGGADLPTQKEIFIPGGRLFRDLTQLSAAGIPTIALVFGNSTAGGAYVPGMCDHVVMIKERSKVFLGGPPLVKMATGEDSDDESLGGAEMHARMSGLADYFAADELDAIRIGRRIVARLNWRKLGPAAGRGRAEPLLDAEELLGHRPDRPARSRSTRARCIAPDRRRLATSTSSSRSTAARLVTGWARLHGYPVGILANGAACCSAQEAQKAAQFIQLANQIDTPLLFLQNTTGYMVGTEYEQGGIIKDGAKMINAVSNSHRAAHHADDRRLVRRRQLRHVRARLRPAVPVHLAERASPR